ncbi:MBL fold metallo-hydrolase [Novosphingobium flavum]|uniref:MBL fold metallo-hydrolase n=1 Tax=Novosphingobium flavum TaxID=1778672 RepID=A0A7X1FS03_9SPHN|nr:MBL fold metallo-hydrolase [Novosphingobium flavum]MBC2665287.1 MBL fold metallo-hydrolase [Novosphingobium flavum]
MTITRPGRFAPAAATALAASLLLALPASAQDRPRPAPRPLQFKMVSPGVYWSKEGGNTGVVIGKDGVIVYDVTINAQRAQELQARIAEVTDKPIKAVIISHIDEDHIGGVSAFPKGVRIIAQAETDKLIKADIAAGRGVVPAAYAPTDVVGRRLRLTIAGEPVELLNWGPAHTSGDLVAWFPARKVAMAADIFCMDQPRPYIKPELGGSTLGWVKSAEAVLALKPKWVVVGHGEPQTPGNLRQYMIDSVRTRSEVAALAKKGMALPEIEAKVGEPQPSSVPLPPNVHQAQFSRAIYLEVTGTKAEAHH